jgi:hypothetical protein
MHSTTIVHKHYTRECKTCEWMSREKFVYRAASSWNPVAHYRYVGPNMSKDAYQRRTEEDGWCLWTGTVYGKLISVRPQVP